MPIHLAYPLPHVALITIDNPPKRNAMSRAMLTELAGLWDSLETSSTRCIVVTGAGDKAFNAGADISGDLSASEDTARVINRALLKTSAYSKPIVAAVNGVCAGGGVELLLATDIRLAAPHARFGLPEVKWGIYPFGGATAKLVQQIGYVHAMQLLLGAEMIDAEEARRIDLINRIVPADQLLDAALAVAAGIAANSPIAVQAVKAHISEGFALATLAREAAEQLQGDRVRESADFAEGVSAFRAKRAPRYE
ncbi:MAG: enoyl-CoA hydratase/isomerase family protein [Gammaproteobacteria bacterium]|nr:enoyl-CoA hydratase/isomerase family protein [Gammaproteobacteria bacterium]